MLAARPDLAGVPHLADWCAAGRPLIVRRRAGGDAGAGVPLGLPLPPADGKRRIGVVCPERDLTAVVAPDLRGVRSTAPPPWRAAIDALAALGERFGGVPRPFGGLLWQALTGLSYLTAASDLDLLWSAPTPVPSALLDGIAGVEAWAPMRIDGEVLLPDGAGIQWRELHTAATTSEVLVKGGERLALVPAAGLRSWAAA